MNNIPDNEKPADTEEFPIITPNDEQEVEPDAEDELLFQRRPWWRDHTRHYYLSSDRQKLFIYWWTSVRPGWFYAKQRTLHQQELLIRQDGLVNFRLIKRAAIRPTDTEKHLNYLKRLNWSSHGIGQIIVFLAWLGGFIGMFAHLYNRWLWPLVGAWTGFSGVIYIIFWMPWMFTYIIATDERFQRHYMPPSIIPNDEKEIKLEDIRSLELKQSYTGNLLGYGKITASTASEEPDRWPGGGQPYITNCAELREILSNGGSSTD